MKILTLPVNKAAFEMLSDPNPETRKMSEYRVITKFWGKRLIAEYLYVGRGNGLIPEDDSYLNQFDIGTPKKFDLVKFTNGYGHKVPSVTREWKGLTIEKPNPLWVPKGFLDLDLDYFSIQLGDIINKS
jgi:hypothetical protein